MNASKVSICCAYYNRADFLKEMLESLLTQDYENFEIVIVNDGSTDPKVKTILDEYSNERLKVIHQDNKGFVAAINVAIENADGDYIAIQGAGDISYPNRIALQSALLDKFPVVGAVGCRYQLVAVSSDRIYRKLRISKRRHSEIFDVNAFLGVGNPFSHGEVMFRKSIFNAVGGYRTYFKFAQDRDLWLRMGEICKFYALDDVLYERRSFYEDGVSADRHKLLLQQALSNFAQQCFYDRKIFGRDFVQIYPSHAGIFRAKSARFSRFMTKQAIQYIYLENLEGARTFTCMAYREKPSLLNFFTDSLIHFSRKSSKFHKFIIKIIACHPSSKLWDSIK